MNGAGLGQEISETLLDLVEAEPSREVAQSTLELFFEDKRLVNNRGIEDMLANSFTAEEREDMAVDGEIEVVCEFCSTAYHFNPHQFDPN